MDDSIYQLVEEFLKKCQMRCHRIKRKNNALWRSHCGGGGRVSAAVAADGESCKAGFFLKTYIRSDGIIKIPLLFDIIHTNVRY